MARALVLAACLMALVCMSNAHIIFYNDLLLQNDDEGSFLVYQKVGMYTPEDAPAGNEPSYVEIDTVFRRESANNRGIVEVLLFHSADFKSVGSHNSDGSVDYCCTRQLAEEGSCNAIGRVIVRSTNVQPYKAGFAINATETRLHEQYFIKNSGVHYLYFANCDRATSNVYINGVSEWKNPYGYLPGQFYGLLPFYGIMSLCYLFIGFIWMVLSLIHWREITRLQNYVAFIIALGMAEMTTTFFYWDDQNKTGTPDPAPEIIGALLNVVKRSVSRVLVLLVAMGYGVVRPTLGTTMYKVIFLGLIYFVFAGLLEIVESINMASGVSGAVRILFIIPVAGLDASFIWLIFYYMTRTMSTLTVRRQSVKLWMYRRFSYTLIAAVALSVLCGGYQIYLEMSNSLDSRWDTFWLVRVYWHIIYFIILLSTVILWRPSKNNHRYAYSEELGSDDADDIQPLTTLVGDTKMRGDEPPKKQPPKKNLPPASFTIEDDGERELEMGKMD